LLACLLARLLGWLVGLSIHRSVEHARVGKKEMKQQIKWAPQTKHLLINLGRAQKTKKKKKKGTAMCQGNN
jgi:hypothetical protein